MPIPDPRHIANGREIPTETYSDQPYIVKTDDGAWLCIMTTGAGREGQPGQHIVTMRSTDLGRTWEPPVDVEPADGPEASYAVLLKIPSGRVYCFYNHNTDNMRYVLGDPAAFADGKCKRVDSLGHFVCKYTDDHGKTWSAERYELPMREMDIDRKNSYAGKVKFFWNVGKPFIHDGCAYVSVHKVGGFGVGFFTRSEGVLLACREILTSQDPATFTWETLPDGDFGLCTPPGGGPIAEEQSYSVLSDGSVYCVYRSIDGHPCCCYSRDRGHSWSEPQYKQYADGRAMKHPRAANFAWKCSNGKFLYWFHNHGGRFVLEHPQRPTRAYNDRNPVWLCGGVEADSPEGKVILWSQPEIVLYDDDTYIRMSYPDLVEEHGRYVLTETQKDLARVHEVDAALVEGLWGQFEEPCVATEGLLLDLPETGSAMPSKIGMPKLPEFTTRDSGRADHGTKDLRVGFAVDMWVWLDSLDAGQVLLDSRAESGQGLCLHTTPKGTIGIVLNDGRTENRWDCDPGMIEPGKLHHVAVIVDGGPKIITFVVDSKLNDGGEHRQFGWGRFSPHLRHANAAPELRIAPSLHGEVRALRIYGRYLRTSEAVGNYRAGCGA